MIRADELREFRPLVRYSEGKDITLDVVQAAISECAEKLGIPVAFSKERVKSGGMFNSSIEDCIVMFHPEHTKDYYKFCIRVKYQGTYAFIQVNDFGESTQMNKAGYAEAYKADRKGQKMSYKVGSMIGQGLMTMGRNQAKLEEEQMYYQCIMDIFDEIVS